MQRVDAIYELLRGQQVQLAVGLRKDVAMLLAAAGGEAQSKDSIGNIITALGEESTLEKETDVTGSDIDENDSAVIRLANQIIIDAYKARASDIHVEPYGPQKDTMIRLRIDGHCREYQRIPGAYRRALAARLKIMAQLDIAERRKPQDGKIKFKLPDGRDIELRVATVPTQGGNEDVVMRILAASEPIPVDKLGMLDRNLRETKAAAEKPYGLILCVGPTGSGKPTTLHALLCVLAQRLVRRVCADCKEEYHPEKEEFDELVHAYGEDDFPKLGLKYDDDFTLYRGKGCQQCNNSGYRGRAGIHELLVASDSMKKLIQSKARVAEMVKVAKEEGMTTLVQDGIQKALEGITDIKMVKAVAIK